MINVTHFVYTGAKDYDCSVAIFLPVSRYVTSGMFFLNFVFGLY